jgi:hypothetical protein
MRYFVRLPDGDEREFVNLAALEAAHELGEVEGDELVRSELQEFWYPVAELVGESETRALIFPCHGCQHMIHSRRIDMGHPIACPACHAVQVVPDVRKRKKDWEPVKSTPEEKARSRVVLGVLILIVGLGPLAYWYFHPRPGYNADRYPWVYTVLVYAGLALVLLNWKKFRKGEW